MNRQQMIAILSNMSDEKLVDAMSATGVPMQDEKMDLGTEEPEGLEGWNAREVPMGDPQKPSFFDKSKMMRPAMQAARPMYADPRQDMPEDMTAWMPQQADGTI